ncbi:hypothetical protein GIB67_031325 [Kingdonia uniflora]|uniref:KIB1-4 beta-propeller domain-containing protein n=1 Tax=Kingdonia uniflora TaxID=39325 RepID=A0A7J7NS82_9MAGN|nr:hypothetical protein GIB67_031325 [Kingdonia uniflora]
MGNWSELPSELLEDIASRVYSANFVDYIRLYVVCKSWRSVFATNPTHLPPHAPLIMFSSPATWDPRFPSNSGFLSRFYGIADNHARDLGLLRHSLSNGWSCRARGFGHGWQVISESIDRVFLLNPITQSEISLPSLAMLPSIEGWAMIDGVVIILKAVITSHPTLLENGDDCIVVAIVSLFECANQRFISEGPRNMRRDPLEKLVFCKVGDQKWTVIQDNQEREFIDLAYCNGFLYAWGQSSEALVFCKLGPSPKVTQISLKPEYFKASRYSQLIESCGDLLCVMWSFDRNNEVLGFIIARLEQNNKNGLM